MGSGDLRRVEPALLVVPRTPSRLRSRRRSRYASAAAATLCRQPPTLGDHLAASNGPQFEHRPSDRGDRGLRGDRPQERRRHRARRSGTPGRPSGRPGVQQGRFPPPDGADPHGEAAASPSRAARGCASTTGASSRWPAAWPCYPPCSSERRRPSTIRR